MISVWDYFFHDIRYFNFGVSESVFSLSSRYEFDFYRKGPLLIGKNFLGFIRRIKISNGLGGAQDQAHFMKNFHFDSPPLCSNYHTYSSSCQHCDRACLYCVGGTNNECTGGCTLLDPPTDPASLYPWGKCPPWVCDGRCGTSQYSCEVP